MLRTLTLIAATALLGACGNVDRYEAGVYHYQPTYCYQSIGAVRCYRTPNHRDEKRLVNYYGPSPTRYDKPAPPPKRVLYAPPPVPFYVRDPEPVPQPVPPRTAAVAPSDTDTVREYETNLMLAPASPTRIEFKVPTLPAAATPSAATPAPQKTADAVTAEADAPNSAPVVPVQRSDTAEPVIGL
jgi:hypothetical protein